MCDFLGRNGREYNSIVQHLFIINKKACGCREESCSIVIEFVIYRKLAMLIKMCLNETYSRARIGKHLFDAFPVQNDLAVVIYRN
jgi:hypothetical protein